MTLERGFRRLTIVGSVMVLVLGLTIDATGPILAPHATVEVTIKDGRKFILERHGPRAFLTDRDSLQMALPEESYGPWRQVPYDVIDKAFEGMASGMAGGARRSGTSYYKVREHPEVLSVRLIRGPEYWWWTDTVWTKAAAGLVLLLWLVFYVVRWIIRGFIGSR
jgi:hypothetical protein